jgi:thiamine-monophosphate kinase
VEAYNSKQLLDFLRSQLSEQHPQTSAHTSSVDTDNLSPALTAVTVDSLVAGVHFPIQTPPQWVAHKALAVNLSDLAAMGAMPVSITLGLVLPDWDAHWLQAFSSGLSTLFHRWDLQLIACDVRKGPLSVTVQAHGQVNGKSALLRSRARPGEQIFVSGTLGDAACALPYYLARKSLPEPYLDFLQQRFNCPEPRLDIGLAIVDIASSAIDISDGLASDLGHILEESDTAALVHIDKLPASEAIMALLDDRQRFQCQLGGGDDYELCFTVAADKLQQLHQRLSMIDVACTWIGEIVAGKGVGYLLHGHKVSLDVAGYDHFAAVSREE